MSRIWYELILWSITDFYYKMPSEIAQSISKETILLTQILDYIKAASVVAKHTIRILRWDVRKVRGDELLINKRINIVIFLFW
jgi:hypothetical protein